MEKSIKVEVQFTDETAGCGGLTKYKPLLLSGLISVKSIEVLKVGAAAGLPMQPADVWSLGGATRSELVVSFC